MILSGRFVGTLPIQPVSRGAALVLPRFDAWRQQLYGHRHQAMTLLIAVAVIAFLGNGYFEYLAWRDACCLLFGR